MVFAGTLNLVCHKHALGRHLRCGVLNEDWVMRAWDNLLVTCCRSNLILFCLVWQAISHPWTGVVGPRKMSKWRACGLFLRTLKASHR